MIKRLAHLCLEVKDMERSVAFYRDSLGLPIAFTFKKDGKFKGAYFALGGDSFLEVFEMDKPVGITHFCLETGDIDAFIANATAHNIRCTPKKLGGCHTWQTWLSDPDGNTFEVHQYTKDSMQLNGGVCEIDWR